ncbi:MAG: helix-turn-helix transcriptional regulator [Flavobacteriaceae bacterium]
MIEKKHSDKEFLKRIGKRIRIIRLSKKIRQNEIAYRCNFDKSSYNNIEAGKRNLTLLNLRKIAKALDVDIIDLLQTTSTQK